MKKYLKRIKWKRIIKESGQFDAGYYLHKYPDVRHKDIDPLWHFVRYGAPELRNPNVIFDTAEYLDSYSDVDPEKINPFVHYILYGKNENRNPGRKLSKLPAVKLAPAPAPATQKTRSIAQRPAIKKYIEPCWNTVNLEAVRGPRVAIFIHVYYLDIAEIILKYVRRLDASFELVFTVSGDKKKALKDIIRKHGVTHKNKIISVDNKGYDVMPFLRALKEVGVDRYDLVCKLHTKKGGANLESVIPGIEPLWMTMLLKSMIGSPESVSKIFSAFNDVPALSMVGCADFYKSVNQLMYGNERYVSELMGLIKPGTDFSKDCGFFAGTMFWIRPEILTPLITNLDEIYALSLEQQESKTGLKSSYFHAVERIFGVLAKDTVVGLVHSNDFDRDKIYVTLDESGRGFNGMGIGMVLDNEYRICESYQLLKNSKLFDNEFYSERFLHGHDWVDPILHFLRSGAYQNYSPDPNFDLFACWQAYPSLIRDRQNALVYYLRQDKNKMLFMPSEHNIAAMEKIISGSKFFCERFYFAEYPDVRRSGIKASVHYAQYGWKEGRLPSDWFDSCWYEQMYLQGFHGRVNPVVYHEKIGRNLGHKIRPEFLGFNQSSKLPDTPLRICLFAGYDKDGVVDETVIDFVRELSRFSDVYYLCDSDVSATELAKIKPFTKGAWAYRHGEYDFGSYKRLAQNHVGWDIIEKYDELLFVNDSSYLVSSLEPVFEKMNKKDISWWGLQATKGIYDTRDKRSNQFKERKLIKDLLSNEVKGFFSEKAYDFLVGSYFLAYRKNVIKDPGFRKIINGVGYEKNKKLLILRYEIGLTKYLLSRGFSFDTFVDYLYPFHPIYTNHIYDLISEGFPLFKRYFITNNHYRQKKLYQWQERLKELCPELDLKPIERNILRVADASKLFVNLDVEKNDIPLMSDKDFLAADKKSVVNKNIWVFPVCGYNHNLDDNVRAVFEHVKNDASIKKIVLFLSRQVRIDGVNFELLPLHSRKAQEYLLESGVIFIKHAPKINIPYPLDYSKHKFINLWHGIPLKKIGVASMDLQHRLDYLYELNSQCHCTIAASDIDRLAMAASFYPMKYSDVWLTGLPRHDFILNQESQLPIELQNDLNKLNSYLEGRRFILYAPTFRNAQAEAYYQFTDSEKNKLFRFLEKNDLVLGIREHMADKAHSYTAALQHSNVLNMGNHFFATIETLYRKADMLITDYSSCFIDFMLTDKPMISFAYDYERYRNEERGTFYELDYVFPGPICSNFDSLYLALKTFVENDFQVLDESYQRKKDFFHKFADDNNSARVVEHVKDIKW